jgi:hypothetical protein
MSKAINYWWVTRPKRSLTLVPEILATIVENSTEAEWNSNRSAHLSLENKLENANLKREGPRRDRTGGGGRTYVAWLKSLGLLFEQKKPSKLLLTLAGEAIMDANSPVSIIKHQIFKYQFPSSYSLNRNVNVNPRFQIRPFIFMLKLLLNSTINYLTKDEIAKIIIIEAENESKKCYDHVVNRILEYREKGDHCLSFDFHQKYQPGKNNFKNLHDIANTIANWLEYTQLAKRKKDKLYLINEKSFEAQLILDNAPHHLIDRPEDHEYFQRKFGVDPNHKKDLRNLTNSVNITEKMVNEQRIKQFFISESKTIPITDITTFIIDVISEKTCFEFNIVEDILNTSYPKGSIDIFLDNYYDMAYQGPDNAIEFEKATAEIFENIFKFKSQHIGSKGKTPDVLIISPEDNYCGIIDTKAYREYAINNDHKNRMIHNYINGINNYYDGSCPLAFFSYIAGGFNKNIDIKIQEIVNETSVNGSAISAANIIEMVKLALNNKLNNAQIKEILSLGRLVNKKDIYKQN